ncbi:MAG: LptF/LptG family permease [Melioribacter sp.]|nr:LptF/LptG family permease [Melioribacter sp.]
MKIIDRYLTKQFLESIFFGLIAFTFLFVVIDMMEKLGDFIDQNVDANIIIQYYLVFTPEIIRLMTPVAVLLASLFTVGKLSNQNELTAIKSSGISFYRFTMPFFITSLIISLFSVYFGGYIVPMANKHKVFIEQTYLKKGIVYFGSNIYFQDTKTRIVTINIYDLANDQANQISIQEFDPKDNTRLIERIDAFRMKYDTTKSCWILYNGIKRTFSDTSETIEKFITKEFCNLHFKPEDVIKKQRKPEELSLPELDELAKEQKRTGNDPTQIQIEYQSRIAYAFSSVIVVLFGLPISAGRRKTSLAMHFGINLLITFIYLVFMKVSQAFGKNGLLNPFFTAWFSNFIFLIAAFYNIKRTLK